MLLLEKPFIELLYKQTKVSISFDKKDADSIVKLFGNLKIGEEYDISVKKQDAVTALVLCDALALRYGTDWLDESGDHVYVLMKDNDRYRKLETTHYRPTDAVEDRKGTYYRWFVLLLPSHLMNTKEMSDLIDGTVSEAKELGIDTRTPDEIERMKQLWANTAAY